MGQYLWWSWWALVMVACEQLPFLQPPPPSVPPSSDTTARPESCDQFSAEWAIVRQQLSALTAMADDLDVSDTAQVSQRLAQFLAAFEASSAAITQLYATHEVGCRTPLAAAERFDDVLTTLYQPYAILLGEQHTAVLKWATLLGADPNYAEAVRQLQRVAEQLRGGVTDAVTLCEYDFDASNCARFKTALVEAMPVP